MHVALTPATAALRSPAADARAATGPRSFGAVLDRLGPPPSSPAPALASSARVALREIERARADLDAAVAAARGGQTFSPAELLALQAQAYRYSQSFEVASRIVEQATQAVKQAVNTQV